MLALATGNIPNTFFKGPAGNQVTEAVVGGNKLKIEVADTKEKRAKGLGGKQSLASDSGMLFIFEKDDRYAFWMKGVSFAIDFIWINDMQVVDFIKSAQPPKQGLKDEELPLYMPNQPIDSVLEVPSGYIDSHSVKVGDEVRIIR